MTEIKFSIFGNQTSPLEDPAFLLNDFMQQAKCSVKVDRLSWEEAWPKILGYGLYGGGPHISQIGSIWTSTLVSMNVLRPFSANEIAPLGGVEAFFRSTWQDAALTDNTSAWAIPFYGFTYLVLYRRDLLRRAGVDEKTAFSTAANMRETLEKLKSAGIPSPFVLPSGSPYRSRIHILASWIWGAGGDFINPEGRHVLFAEPEALNGMEEFFELYRYLDDIDHNLTYEKCGIAFATGDAAATIIGSSARTVLKEWHTREVVDNLGVAVVPGVPWVGGANLVIWKETRMHPESEQAALALLKFLSTSASQTKLAQASSLVPSRVDAMEQLDYHYVPLKSAINQSLLKGRSYHPVPLWVRIMSELRKTFDSITTEVVSFPERKVREILDSHLTPLAERFNLMLSK